MKKKPPTPGAWKKREKFQALADYGIAGEQVNAKAKLAELEARFDFTGAVPDPVGPDIFRSIKTPEPAQTSRAVANFGRGEDEAASFVKWALQNAFNVQGTFRAGLDGITLCAHIAARSVRGVASVAASIRDSFAQLWHQFAALPGATSDDRRLFLRGLYDGMMNDERGSGELLPARRITPARPIRGKRGAVSIAPGVAVHPYAVALDLGRKIRMMVPAVELVAELRDTEAAARLTTSATIAA